MTDDSNTKNGIDAAPPRAAEIAREVRQHGKPNEIKFKISEKLFKPERLADKPWRDPEVCRRLFVDEDRSIRACAEELDCRPQTFSRWLAVHGIRDQVQGGGSEVRAKLLELSPEDAGLEPLADSEQA